MARYEIEITYKDAADTITVSLPGLPSDDADDIATHIEMDVWKGRGAGAHLVSFHIGQSE